jgi:hypothetical protein
VSKPRALTGQGTRLDETPPWESYGKELTENMPKDLAQGVEDYSKRIQDTKPSNQNLEELARQREMSKNMVKKYQFLTPEEYGDLEPRIGRVMHSAVFISKLRTECHLDCWYVQHPHPDKAILVVNRRGNVREVACWVQQGFMIEYEMVRFDRNDLPIDSKRRGWRTCLLQMIQKHMLTEDQVNRVFGKATGPVSKRYNSTIYDLRNNVKVEDEALAY